MSTALSPYVALPDPPGFDPVEARRERGRAIAALCKIKREKKTYIVPSQTGNGAYRVKNIRADAQCDCPDFEERRKPCKHVFAVLFVLNLYENGDGFLSGSQAVALMPQTKAPRPTYKQDWPAYNKAQTTEKHRFQVLLRDLCRGVVEPPRTPKRGMQPLCMADAIFAAVFKVYSTVSGRRFSCDLADAHAKGYMDRLPHYNTVFHYLENPSLTPILKALIAESAKPLKAVEVDFAVDSSGFTSCRFIKWFDHKYGVPRQEHDWVKVSVMTGVKTNIVTAVEVDERYAGDCPQFAPLVRKTVETFKPREISADAAYLSYENMELTDSIGATPFILFKANTTAAQGGVFEKMFHFYNFNREDFLSHYHKRSNVETTFSMIKAKFGDSLRSKTDTAMANEALAKVLCHNLCCIIQSMYELGINPVFWGVEEMEAAEVEEIEAVAPPPSSDDLIDMFAWM
jgi:transposase